MVVLYSVNFTVAKMSTRAFSGCRRNLLAWLDFDSVVFIFFVHSGLHPDC